MATSGKQYTVESIRSEAAAIVATGRRGESEQAIVYRSMLWGNVLRAIAEGRCVDVAGCAAEAAKLQAGW